MSCFWGLGLGARVGNWNGGSGRISPWDNGERSLLDMSTGVNVVMTRSEAAGTIHPIVASWGIGIAGTSNWIGKARVQE
jgi:hypothetical protein